VPDEGPYDVGDEITLEATFDVDGVLTNPTSTVCTVRKPDGSTTTPTVTNPSTGKFQAKVTPAVGEHGDWQYRFDGTGTAKAGGRKMFLVRPQWQ
jgi:hypothetical protein